MSQTTPPKKPFMTVDPDNKLVKRLFWIGVGGASLNMVILFFAMIILEPFTSFDIFSYEKIFFDILPLTFVGSMLLIFVCGFLLREPETDGCCRHQRCCRRHTQFKEHSTLHEESSAARFERLGYYR